MERERGTHTHTHQVSQPQSTSFPPLPITPIQIKAKEAALQPPAAVDSVHTGDAAGAMPWDNQQTNQGMRAYLSS